MIGDHESQKFPRGKFQFEIVTPHLLHETEVMIDPMNLKPVKLY